MFSGFRRIRELLGRPLDASASGARPVQKRPDVQASPPPRSLVERISRNGPLDDPNTPRPLLTLEEFFEGNNDYGSIGYNFYPDQPAPSEFYEVFKRIWQRPEVIAVYVEVQDQVEQTDWPSTSRIWVITTASSETVRSWLGERFAPDDLLDGFIDEIKTEPCEVPPGTKALGVWWD